MYVPNICALSYFIRTSLCLNSDVIFYGESSGAYLFYCEKLAAYLFLGRINYMQL